jgi:uncharacterized protein GlcG (DUF336 family)
MAVASQKPKNVPTHAGIALCISLFLLLLATTGCGSSSNQPTISSSAADMTAADVQTAVQNAAMSVNVPIVIAVTDRGGNILGVFQKTGAPATSVGNFGAIVPTTELAVGLARTASFFSNDQAPLTSRTVRFISGIHFPPGIGNTPNAALYGIENTNRGCPLNANFLPGQSISPARSIDGTQTGLGIQTGKADIFDSNPNAVNPAGVPLFKNGHLAGGIGVAGASTDITEFAAASGASGFGTKVGFPGVVVIDGISLPEVVQTTRPAGLTAGSFTGSFIVGPNPSPGGPPEGDLVPVRAGTLGGLTQSEVQSIVDQAIATANQTRAVIRLPEGQRAKFVIAVADLDGSLLALHRMPDATIFSIDVAVGKARNMIYFSSSGVNPADLPGVPPGTAVTNRTISFAAQPFFPSGIDGTPPGPFFGLYQFDIANPCTNGRQPANPNQNGIVFFPGSVALYRGNVLVGGLGVSGDGVEQDDFVTNGGSLAFPAPTAIRADQIIIRNVRLPYLKFPRDPTL